MANNVAMIARMQDLNDILVYVKVVESGSFTAAGDLLNLPRSSVSRKVSRLEEELGVRLLHRTTRSLSMTPAGQTYFERASRAFAELADVTSVVAGLGEVASGPLRVTAPMSFVETGQGLFVEFLEAYPEVRLEVDLTDRFVDIVEEGFDIAIRGGKPPDPSLEGHRILTSSYELLAAVDYLEKRGRPTCPSDLREHDCLILGNRSPDIWSFETGRGTVEVPVSGRMASTNVHALLEATRRGLGISRLPTRDSGMDTSGLEVVLPELSSPGGGLWMVYPSAQQLLPAVKAFIDFVDDYLSRTIPGRKGSVK